jgi:hypothetical protein
MALGAEAVAQNVQQNFSRNVGETEQHLLHYLPLGNCYQKVSLKRQPYNAFVYRELS